MKMTVKDKKNKLIQFFEKWYKNIKGNESLDDIFKDEKIPANHAYMVSQYGYVTTKEQLLKDFFANARRIIYVRSERHLFSAIIELPEDIKEYLPKIIEHYRSYGYNVIVIDENTAINNAYNEKSSHIKMTLLVLTWGDSKEEIQKK